MDDYSVSVLDFIKNAWHVWVAGEKAPSVVVSESILDIAAHARYRAVLYSLEANQDICQPLLKPFQKFNEDTDKKSAEKAMQLNLKVLSAIKDYELVFKCTANHEQLDSQLPFIQAVGKAFQKEKENPFFYSKHTHLEEKVFLKVYKPLSKKARGRNQETEGVLSQFLKNKRNNARKDEETTAQMTLSVEDCFLKYFLTTAHYEACKTVLKDALGYYERALEEVKYQTLFEAVKAGPIALENFITQYKKALNNIHFNRYFKISLLDGQDLPKCDAIEPLHEPCEESDTLLTWVLKQPFNSKKMEDLVHILCNNGADINLIGNISDKKTPLHTAIAYEAWSAIPVLFKKYANQEPLNKMMLDDKGRTAFSALVDKIDEHFSQKDNCVAALKEHNGIFLRNIYVAMTQIISKNTVNRIDEMPKRRGNSPFIKVNPFFKFMGHSFRLVGIDMKQNGSETKFLFSIEFAKGAPSFEEFLSLFLEKGADFDCKETNGDTLVHRLAATRGICYFSGKRLSQEAAEKWVYFLSSYTTSLMEMNQQGRNPSAVAIAACNIELSETINRLAQAQGYKRPVKPRQTLANG